MVKARRAPHGPVASPTASQALTLLSWPRSLCGLCPLPGTCSSWRLFDTRTSCEEDSVGSATGASRPGFWSLPLSGGFYRDTYLRGKGEGWTGFVHIGLLERERRGGASLGGP